ncbi:MAG: hypothetical protein MI976_08485 [Pseudomonadales bacterium]|nr:hypothetical protein [Pseudomonadales bacterium]
MITSNHVSVKRREQAINSLQARIDILTQIVKAGIVPDGFEYHLSNSRLMRWVDEDRGILKIGVNTARDKHPLLWKELQDLRDNIINIEKKTKIKKIQETSKTKSEILRKSQDANRKIKSLTNELITLRCAYLDLLSILKQEKHKSKVIQQAIKRHHQHHGLQSTIKGDV